MDAKGLPRVVKSAGSFPNVSVSDQKSRSPIQGRVLERWTTNTDDGAM